MLGNDLQQRVGLTAVANNDPSPPNPGVLDNLTQPLAMRLQLVFGIQDGKTGVLTIEVKNRLRRNGRRMKF